MASPGAPRAPSAPLTPSTPTSALASSQGRGPLVHDTSALDDKTLEKLLELVEEVRRRRHRFVAVGVVVTSPLLAVGAFIPPLGLPIVGIGALALGSYFELTKRTLLREAMALGVSANAMDALMRRATRVSSMVPRWVVGEARVRTIRRALRDDEAERHMDEVTSLASAATRR